MKNISGEFPIMIDDKEIILTMNYGAAEKLERQLLGKSLMQCLTETLNGVARMSDVVTVFHACLSESDRKKWSTDTLGQAIMQAGLKHYAATYTALLTYALTGDVEPKVEATSTKKK